LTFGLQNRQRISRFRICFLLGAALAALAAPTAAVAWTWPVEGPVVRAFDFDDPDPQAPGQHRGIDIAAASGTPVRAPVDATVTFAGTVPYGGKTLSLLTSDGLSVTLLHLGTFVVGRGATVAEGAVVGTVGPTGVVELPGPFVYMGVRRVEDPQGYLDPLLFLPKIAPPAPVPPLPGPQPAPAPAPAPQPTAPPPSVEPPAPAPPAAEPQPPTLRIPRPQPTLPEPLAPHAAATPARSGDHLQRPFHHVEQTAARDLPREQAATP